MPKIAHILALTFAGLLLALPDAGAGQTLTNVTAIQILERRDARFPGSMRVVGVKEGKASIVLAIGKEGQLQDSFVLNSSHRAFAESALKSLSQWRFAPASYESSPIDSSVQIDLNFQIDRELGWQIQAPAPANITSAGLQETSVSSTPFEQLDQIPLPLRIVDPSGDTNGRATIEFYIDEMGAVRCPRLIASTGLEVGELLLTTVSQWRFEPPLNGGKRTNTMVKQTLSYAEGQLSASANTH